MLATIEDTLKNPRASNPPELSHITMPFHKDAYPKGGFSFRDYFQSDLYRQKQRLLDEKIRKVINYGYDQKIRKRVIPIENNRGTDYSLVDDDFKTATITSEALKKGNHISKRMGETPPRPLEIYLYSIDNLHFKENEITAIRDLYIAKEQEAFTEPYLRCRVSGYGTILSNIEVRDKFKKKIIGWAHSHALIDPFFSSDDRDNIATLLQTNGLTKRIRVFDSSVRGKGYKGVEYEVKYAPAIVFNALNAKPFVAIAVEYTRGYDGKKVFHINENCQLRIIEENNGIDMDPASIDRQIMERVCYNGRRLGEIRGIRYKTEPVKGDTGIPLTERVQSEKEYAQMQQRLIIRDKRLRALYKGLKLKYGALRAEQEQSREALKILTTRVEGLEALTNHSYIRRFISKLRKNSNKHTKEKIEIEN